MYITTSPSIRYTFFFFFILHFKPLTIHIHISPNTLITLLLYTSIYEVFIMRIVNSLQQLPIYVCITVVRDILAMPNVHCTYII